MFGLLELVTIIYLASFVFYLLAIINSLKIKEKKIFYFLLSIVSLPVSFSLGGIVNNLLTENNIITSFKGSAILFLSIAIAVFLAEIAVYICIRRIKLKIAHKED